IEGSENLFVLCDRMRLRQILLSLTGNAVKFTNVGKVTIEVRGTTDNDEIAFRISDTGVGMSAEDLPLLFQEFRQIDGSLTRAHNGTGLGLAISKRLAEKMGGNIVAQSKLGVGSVFLLNLPIRQNIDSLPSPETP